MSGQTTEIKRVLAKLYARYNHKEFIPPDPLQFVYQYTNPIDMEIAGFLSAALAYGRVQQIEKSLTSLFKHMGKSPHEFIMNFNAKQRKELQDFKHRFTTGEDISDLLKLLQIVLNKYGSIEEFFIQGYNPSNENIIPALSKFCDSLSNMYAAKHNGQVSSGLKYLLADPSRGSACKRLNLFLRWMVRDDEVDSGLWKSIDKAKLIMPVDVHIARLSRILGFCERKTASLAAAVEITERFTEIEPADPVKYDFALSRIGIVGNCTGQIQKKCKKCELSGLCTSIK